jgi:hypothetical protein
MKTLGLLIFNLENIIPFYDQIEAFITDTLNLPGYIQDGYNFVIAQDAITQLLGTLVIGIIFIMGAFELIKKLSKIIIVVAILVGLYLLYQNGSLDGLIGA